MHVYTHTHTHTHTHTQWSWNNNAKHKDGGITATALEKTSGICGLSVQPELELKISFYGH